MRKQKSFIAAFLLAAILSGCAPKQTLQVPEDIPSVIEDKPSVVITEPSMEEIVIDYKEIKANESGKIMVLMYHHIGEKEDEWVRTPENFKKDLKTLYDKGYRTVSLRDYINNNINVPAGYTPVVITFDDGNQNQFNLIEKDGEFIIDSSCAVGIMKDFAKEYPDFGSAATFYVYYPVPFRQRDKIKEKFDYLISNGFDIGNHSYTHEALGKLDANGIQKQLALNVKMTGEYLPGYNVDSLALPYGSRPKDENLRKYIVSGEYEGTEYNNRAVLLVGSNPAPAPGNKNFDASAIPRIRASEMKTAGTGIYDWLKYFDIHPEERYISDGDPDTIVIPVNNEDKLNIEALKDKKIIKY